MTVEKQNTRCESCGDKPGSVLDDAPLFDPVPISLAEAKQEIDALKERLEIQGSQIVKLQQDIARLEDKVGYPRDQKCDVCTAEAHFVRDVDGEPMALCESCNEKLKRAL